MEYGESPHRFTACRADTLPEALRKLATTIENEEELRDNPYSIRLEKNAFGTESLVARFCYGPNGFYPASTKE
jgi:hypothetical protein